MGGPWPLDVMKQHPPPDTARTAHSQTPPVLLLSPHLNRNTWDALTLPGRVSGPLGSPRCAELAGRTLCLRSSDGRRRSSTLRTEQKGEETAPSALQRGWRVAGDARDRVRRRTGPLWPRAESSRRHCLGALQAPGHQGRLPCWQRGRLSHQGPLMASGSACEAPGAPPGLALLSSTLGSLGSASHDRTLTEEELLLVDEEREATSWTESSPGKMPRRRLKGRRGCR